jgi:hypothetical protein
MADVLSKSGPHLLEPDRWQIECHPVRWYYVQKAYMRLSMAVKPGDAASACGAASRSERAIRCEFLRYPIR